MRELIVLLIVALKDQHWVRCNECSGFEAMHPVILVPRSPLAASLGPRPPPAHAPLRWAGLFGWGVAGRGVEGRAAGAGGALCSRRRAAPAAPEPPEDSQRQAASSRAHPVRAPVRVLPCARVPPASRAASTATPATPTTASPPSGRTMEESCCCGGDTGNDRTATLGR